MLDQKKQGERSRGQGEDATFLPAVERTVCSSAGCVQTSPRIHVWGLLLCSPLPAPLPIGDQIQAHLRSKQPGRLGDLSRNAAREFFVVVRRK